MTVSQDPSGSSDDPAASDGHDGATDERERTIEEQQRLIAALQQARELGGEIHRMDAPSERDDPADDPQRTTNEQEHVRELRRLADVTARPADAAARSRQTATQIWPLPTFLLGMILLSFVLLPAAGFRAGAVPEKNVRASGVAEVRSCERSVVLLGLAHACEAMVTWASPGVPAAEKRGETTVYSIQPLRGTVDVVERGGRDQDSRIVPVSHPYRASLAMLIIPAHFVFAVAGFVVGLRLMGKRRVSPPT